MATNIIHTTVELETHLPMVRAKALMDACFQVLADNGFRVHTATRGHEEIFEFNPPESTRSIIWNVTKAKRLVAEVPREVIPVDVHQLWDLLVPPQKKGEGIEVEWDTINSDPARFDLTYPLVFVHFEENDILIDGWHRVARSKLCKFPNLIAVWLTDEENQACMKIIE